MGKAIPDRWLDYQPIGQRVPSTRFIAFKVPLNENINNTVDEDLRLAPHSLLESVPNLGLIVDLTNTNRYYNPQAFRDQNVEHQKLMIPGHHTPSQALAQRFCDYVTNFLEANADNDKLIGVHCTHGVNRTGYLICYFMITKMNMSPKLAMQTFADARGHQIERENYTSSLLELMKLKLRRWHDSDNSQHGFGKSLKRDKDQWPRHRGRHQDEQRSERSEGNWRQDPKIWQQQQEEYQQRRQEQQQQQQKQQQRHPRFNQDRQQRPQRRWQDNERQESFNRRDNYNDAHNYNEKPEGSWQSQNWRRNRNDHEQDQSYSRNNNYHNDCNYSRDNNYHHNKYSWNSSYNHRQESGTSRNRFSRFNDDQ
ncbi:hypothetical protein ACLKA7_000326 [Drosophila subpalustris]